MTMKRLAFWTAVAAGFALAPVAQPTRADLYTEAQWSYQSDSSLERGTGFAFTPPAGFSCGGQCAGSASAAAHADYLHVGTSASFITLNTTPLFGEGNAVGTAETLDVLTPGGLPVGTSGFLVYDFDISGSNFAIAGSPVSSGSGPVTRLVGGVTGDVADADFRFPLLSSIDGILTFGAASYLHMPAQFEFPIRFGLPNAIELQMSSSVEFVPVTVGLTTFSGQSDFISTIVIPSVELLDANHQPVQNASLVTRSGTFYPIVGSPRGLPEPSTMSLVASAGLLAALAGLGRRRRNAAPFALVLAVGLAAPAAAADAQSAKCALLAKGDVEQAIGPNDGGRSDPANQWGLQGCRWTATSATRNAPPGWLDSIEVAVFDPSKTAWAREQAKGEPVAALGKAAVYDDHYGDLWFECAANRYCVVKVRTASAATREDTARRLAQSVQGRVK
jgi:hypothetical protein